MLTGAALKKAVAALIATIDKLAGGAYLDGDAFTMGELRRMYPDRPVSELEKLLAQEAKFETAFRKKMRERLERDLPEALAIADPKARLDAFDKIMEREKRFRVAREEAMFMRALGKAEAMLLKESSPRGAYWTLSPFVHQHTLDCLAMADQFWPWEVLENFQPPVHHGCACSLLGLDEAVAEGLMTPDQVPDTADAVRRARKALKDAADMEESLDEATIRSYIDGPAIEEAGNVLRWDKGFAHGGQFRPKSGGNPGTKLLRKLIPHPSSPLAKRGTKRGRWAWVNGTYTRIPEADHWEKRVAGSAYVSPPGGTNVYKDGQLFDGMGVQSPEKRPRLALKAPAPPAEIVKVADSLRSSARDDAVSRINAASAHPPVAVGDGPTSLLALKQAGYRLEKATPGGLRFRNAATAAEVNVRFDGHRISYVDWQPVPAPPPEGRALDASPRDFDEHRADAFAWANELGDRYGADVSLPDFKVDHGLGNHAGTHHWDGTAMVGPEVQDDIDAAGRKRAAGEPLNDREKRGVWSSFWTTAHELGHAVNPIDPDTYNDPAHQNLEETLTEEMAHIHAVERLTKQGQRDVIAWRDSHPDAIPVKGVYRLGRGKLAEMLDDGGITDPARRQALIEHLKFGTAPAGRFDELDRALGKEPGYAHKAMSTLDADPGSALSAMSAGRAQVGEIGYGRFTGAKLSPDGLTLTLPDGGVRRVENIPVPEGLPELAGLTDGSALAVYPPGVPASTGDMHRDGSPKSFRWLDDQERGKLILKAFTGKGSPGAPASPGTGWKKLKKTSYGEGTWESKTHFIDQHQNGTAFEVFEKQKRGGEKRISVEKSLEDAQAVADGTKDPNVGDGGAEWWDKLAGTGQGTLGADEQGALNKAWKQTETWKKKKAPPDPMIGKIIGDIGLPPTETGPIPNYDGNVLTLGKGAGGSNGARWAFDKDGHRWLLKTYRGDRDRIATELLANAVYREVGAKVPEAGSITTPPDSPDFRHVPDTPIDEPELPKPSKGRRVSTGVIVAEPDGRLWVYEPKNHFGGYEHTFPKGGVTHGLTGQQNALKELWEETGLHAHITDFVGDYEGDTGVSRYYLAARTGGDPVPGKPGETEAVKLVTPDEAASMLNRDRDKNILRDALAKGLPTSTHEDTFPQPPSRLALTYPTLDGETRRFDPSEAVGEHYMTDALLANWDFVGMTQDNIMWDPDGNPFRVDQGGTFEYRAQGGEKPFGPVPTEVWTMLSKGQGQRGVKISEDQMRQQGADIADKLSDGRIDALVNAAPFENNEMRERIRENLKARVAWMKGFHDGTVDMPRPLEGEAAHDDLFDAQSGIELFPEQEDALYGYVEGMDADVTTALRKGGKKDKMVQRTIDELDSVMRHAQTGEDVIGYIAMTGSDPAALEGLSGKSLQEKGYLGVYLEPPPHAESLLRVTVPAGSYGLYTPMWDDFPATTPDLILARDARLKVGGARDDSPVPTMNATAATQKPFKPYVPPPKPPAQGGGDQPKLPNPTGSKWGWHDTSPK